MKQRTALEVTIRCQECGVAMYQMKKKYAKKLVQHARLCAIYFKPVNGHRKLIAGDIPRCKEHKSKGTRTHIRWSDGTNSP